MYYIGSKLLRPLQGRDPERWIPQQEDLRGVTFDFTDHTVVTYDKVENKLLWLTSDTGTLLQTATVDTMIDVNGNPVEEVLGMCQFGNVAYILVHEGNGQLAVFSGSLQVGRATAIMPATRYGVPPYGANTRYNPTYCNIFNIGSTLYLLLSVTHYPANNTAYTHQYIVEYDLLGFFRNAVRVDLGTGITAPNGLAVDACWNNNVVALLCRTDVGTYNNVVWHLRLTGGTPVYERQDFIYGPLPVGSGLTAAGRFVYSVVGNRVFKSEIIMIKFVMEDGWPNTQSVDLGMVSSGQAVFRRLKIQNINPTQTYRGLTVYTSDPNLVFSKTSSTNKFDYANAITIDDDMAPGDITYFWICLLAPTITDERDSPVQYYDYIYFRAAEVI